jgi:signal transduction histidine kinase
MNSKLLIRVTAPAVVIGLLVLGACLAGARYINGIQSNLAEILSQNVKSLQAAQELEIRVRQLRIHSLRYLFEPGPARLEPIETDQHLFEKALEVVRQTATTPEEKACVKDIEAGYQQYHDEQALLRANARSVKSPLDVNQLLDSHPVKLVVEPCQKLLRLNQERMELLAQESQQASQEGKLALTLLGLAAPIGGIVLGYGMARGLSRSIYRLSVRVQDVANRLDRDVASVSMVADGDIQNLERQLQHILGRVEEVVEHLQQHQRELVRAEQLSAVGQLAASVAHEVRNPLTGIKLLVGAALRSQNKKPLNLEDLEVIHNEVDRLEHTVQAFLDFARLPAPQCSTCDFRDVVSQAIELVRVRSGQQGVEIMVRAPNEAVWVSVDKAQLCTVLINLFLNALDAMPQGGTLEVDLHSLPESGVRLSVADTGSGIPPQVFARLFTPFTTTKPTGTGLGLTISGRIVEEHGGRISASNQPQGGACFVITLPLVSQAPASPHTSS